MNRDVLGVGIFGTLTAFVVDFVAMGGDTLLSVAVWLLSDIDLIVTLLAQLQVLASGPIGWLDAATVQKLYYLAVGVMLLSLVWRLAKSYQDRNTS